MVAEQRRNNRNPRPPASRRAQTTNRVSGPTSALTDFLASNNISAQEIRQNYLRRVAQAEEGSPAESSREREPQPPSNLDTTANYPVEDPDHDEEDEVVPGEVVPGEVVPDEVVPDDVQEGSSTQTRRSSRLKGKARAVEAETAPEVPPSTADRKGKRAKLENGASSKPTGKKELEKQKATAKKAAKKAAGKGGPDSSSDSSDEDLPSVMRKSKRLPGQLTNCEVCSKRFTVTSYTVGAPNGGLLCAPCGKIQKQNDQKSKPAKKTSIPKKRRQNFESSKLDGVLGVPSLQKMCLDVLVKYAGDIEDLGVLSEDVWQAISHIFTKNRALKPETLDIFLKPDLRKLEFQDCAALQTEDFNKIINICPNIEQLILVNSGQFKDETLEILSKQALNLAHVHLYGSNLISSEAWIRFFQERGSQLKTLRLKWMDSTFDDRVLEELVANCPNLERLKISMCSAITVNGIVKLERLSNLKHLSLDLPNLPDPKAASAKKGKSEERPFDYFVRPGWFSPSRAYPNWLGDALEDDIAFPWEKFDPKKTSDEEFFEFFKDLHELYNKRFLDPTYSHSLSKERTELRKLGALLDEQPKNDEQGEASADKSDIRFTKNSPEALSIVICNIGSKLETLSLASIPQLIDEQLVLDIATHCCNLRKLRLTDVDGVSDNVFATLFDRSLLVDFELFAQIPDGEEPASLEFLDMSGCRNWESNAAPINEDMQMETRELRNELASMLDIDDDEDEDPQENSSKARGFGPLSLSALMRKSHLTLRYLNLSSCNNMTYGSLLEVFPNRTEALSTEDAHKRAITTHYPVLESIDVSFCPPISSGIIQSMIYSCPKLTKIVAIACFAAWSTSTLAPKARKKEPSEGDKQRMEIFSGQTIYVPRTCALIGPQEYAILDDRITNAVKEDADIMMDVEGEK